MLFYYFASFALSTNYKDILFLFSKMRCFLTGCLFIEKSLQKVTIFQKKNN
jgi:hypothetical protein